MTTLQLKANSRGSWTNVLTFPPSEEGGVRLACEALRRCSGYSVTFKIEDGAGNAIANLPGAGKRDGNEWEDRK